MVHLFGVSLILQFHDLGFHANYDFLELFQDKPFSSLEICLLLSDLCHFKALYLSIKGKQLNL